MRELLRTQYPNGYEGSITRIINAKKEPIFVFPLETEDATYLIKIPATKNSEGEYDVESVEKGEFGEDSEKPAAPAAAGDDDFDNTNEGFDTERGESSDDFDEEGGEKRSREASYDPDFDG
ncbi:MAG TPA: hypothetical protein VK508_10715 [Cyclobacteriaceae bacterium]|nr:hypothetical protein [Cyclobacteriaceae bacterium]